MAMGCGQNKVTIILRQNPTATKKGHCVGNGIPLSGRQIEYGVTLKQVLMWGPLKKHVFLHFSLVTPYRLNIADTRAKRD